MHLTHLLHWLAGTRRSKSAFLGVPALAALFGAAACLNRPLCDTDCQPRTTNVFVADIKSHNVDKIDLLFMIDNSSSMTDKQTVLQEAVPDLVRRLVDPNCVNPDDGTSTPALPGVECRAPLIREFTPIRDIHVGIITSSLGSHGSTDSHDCVGNDGDAKAQMLNDHGWLIGSRSRFAVPAGGAPIDPTKGFLDWNPVAHPNQSVDAFSATFKEMTIAAGSAGCGFESQLESVYRFLVDPNPPTNFVIGKCGTTNEDCAFPTGKDETLLAQRAAFLRPDSLVAIIMLTDENDCSINESAPQGYYASSQNKPLQRASSACALNPNDHCCYSCGTERPSDCAEDPVCSSKDRLNDPVNLRCFEQQRRFGYDFLYPTERYVNAFKSASICTSRADLDPQHCPDLDKDNEPDVVANPLFKTATAVPREESLIFVAGIVGVPWQDIATDKRPDGESYPPGDLHYQTAKQMNDSKTWGVILGDRRPGNGQAPIPPTDALMQESRTPRVGMDGQNPPRPLADVEAGYLANKVNGHEWAAIHALGGADDLQYACIFPLLEAKPCGGAAAGALGCDCMEADLNAGSKNPLCQDASGNYTTEQRFGKAYPGARELQVLKDFGTNSIVASICARNQERTNDQDYGYRPAVDAIVDRLKDALTGKCLPRPLAADGNGKIPCSVVEVRPVPATGRPSCTASAGRKEANSAVVGPSIQRMRNAGACDALNKPPCTQYYVCEIEEADEKCHTGEAPSAPGWCYIDPANQPGDNPHLVDSCSPAQRRTINFVDPDHRTPANDGVVLVACFGSTIGDEDETPAVTNLESTGGAPSALSGDRSL